jgi:hypothetical protein
MARSRVARDYWEEAYCHDPIRWPMAEGRKERQGKRKRVVRTIQGRKERENG